jgi:hypothetical protein
VILSSLSETRMSPAVATSSCSRDLADSPHSLAAGALLPVGGHQLGFRPNFTPLALAAFLAALARQTTPWRSSSASA